MPTVYDLIAKISWDTNSKELENVIKLTNEENKILEELNKKCQRLSDNMIKTNDTKKVKQLNEELKSTKDRIESIKKEQEKQQTQTEILRKKQKELIEELKKANDPNIVQGLLRNLKQIENQLTATNHVANTLPGKFKDIKNAFVGGIGGGLIGGGISGLISNSINFISTEFTRANEAFEQAENSANELKRILKSSGNERYLQGFIDEADILVKTYRSFDNDDIIKAFGKLANTGKFTRDEMSKLIPVILELSRAQNTDLAGATDMVLNIMAGRGGAVLREYGLNLKGVKTDHERLNFVVETLGDKIRGSNEIFENTIKGQNEIISQEIDALETKIGKYTTNITAYFKKALLGFFEFISDISTSSAEIQKQKYNEKVKEEENRLSTLSDKEFDDFKKLTNLKEKENKRYISEIEKLNEKISPKNVIFSRDAKDYIEEVKNSITQYKELISTNTAFIEAVKNEEELRKKGKDNIIGNKQDEDEEELLGTKNNLEKKLKTIKKSETDAKAIKDKEFQEAIKRREEHNNQELLLIERLNSTGALLEQDYNDMIKEREIQHLDDLIETYNEFGKETIKLETDRLKKIKALKNEYNKRAREEAKKTNITDDIGIFDSGSAIDVPNGFTSAASNEIDEFYKKEGKKTNITRQESEERRKIYKKELYDNIVGFAYEGRNFISTNIDKTNRLIEEQKRRLSESEKSSTASVKIEEARLNELIAKRQKYERQQRIIDASVIVANQAVAISGAIRQIATSKNYIEILANAVAIAAGIAASVSAVRGAFQDTGFYEGGYTGDGDPKEESLALGKKPYKYHKKEFVMNEYLTSKHRDMFEGIHSGELAVKEMNGNYLLSPKLNVSQSIEDYKLGRSLENAQLQSMSIELNKIYDLLKKREIIVNNNFDANGFGMSVAGQLNEIKIKQTLR